MASMVAQALEENANFISFSILRIPNKTLFARYTKIMLAFNLSGLGHYFITIATGIPPSQTGALKFFVMQGLGIMFEDAVQALYRRHRLGKPGPGLESLVIYGYHYS
jgi:hypothetical protein